MSISVSWLESGHQVSSENHFTSTSQHKLQENRELWNATFPLANWPILITDRKSADLWMTSDGPAVNYLHSYSNLDILLKMRTFMKHKLYQMSQCTDKIILTCMMNRFIQSPHIGQQHVYTTPKHGWPETHSASSGKPWRTLPSSGNRVK